MNRTVALAAVLLVPLAAGCLGAPADGPSSTPGPSNDSTSANGSSPVPGDAGPARFDVAPVNRTVWANGSAPITETQPVVYVQGTDRQPVPLDDAIPAGGPVRINATVAWSEPETGQGVFDNIDLHLETTDAQLFDVDSHDAQDGNTGPEHLAATVVRPSGGSVTLIVETQWSRPDPELNWTLHVDVRADPTTVPADVPVAVQVDDPGRFAVRGVDGGHVRVWGPSGDATGGEGSVDVDADRPSGRYVVAASAPARIVGAADLEPVEATTATGPTQAIPPGGSASWSFEVGQAPLLAGLRFDDTGPLTVKRPVNVTLSGPDGTVLAVDQGDFVISQSQSLTWDASVLDGSIDPAARAGEWRVTVDGEPNVNVEVTPLLVHVAK